MPSDLQLEYAPETKTNARKNSGVATKTVAVIGDSLSAFVLASQLERLGHKVILVHSGDGEWAAILNAPKINFFPATESLQTALQSLAEKVDAQFKIEPVDLPPMTFVSGEIKPFVGFGESKNPATQILSKYNLSSQLAIEPSPSGTITGLLSQLSCKKFTFSELTEFKFEGEIISKLVIHGGQEVIADHYVFMSSPNELLQLVPNELIGARLRSRIGKTPIFTEITFQLKHTQPLLSAQNMVFLLPSNEQNEPLVGQCDENFSVWQTFIPVEMGEDPEFVSNVIKNMRRQIRRAFATEEDPSPTIISVIPGASADFTWFADQKEINLIAKNLTVLPALSSPFYGLAQAIDTADSALAHLTRINVDQTRGPVLDLPQ